MAIPHLDNHLAISAKRITRELLLGGSMPKEDGETDEDDDFPWPPDPDGNPDGKLFS